MNTFFVVKDPTTDSTPADFIMEFTARSHAQYIIGGGLEAYQRENHEVHATREDAEADADRRLATACRKLQALRTGPGPAPLSLWAELRGKVSLSEVADMLRQDLEAAPGDTFHAQALAERLAGLIGANAQNV